LILEIAKEIIEEFNLCDRCLGRQFALLISGGGISNEERGKSLKNILLMNAHRKILAEENNKDEELNFIKTLAENGQLLPAVTTLKKYGIEKEVIEDCYICGGILNNLDHYLEISLDNLKGIEFQNFLVGSKFSPEIIEKEDRLRAKYKLRWGETIKGEFNRELGKLLYDNLDNKIVEFDTPEIVIVINTIKDKVELNVNPLFIYGRYLKLIRGIPQTHWTCKKCNGDGCEECDFKGYKYETSIEELIAEKTLELSGGSEVKFHGAGREDIDALMLGTGRPFIIEIKKPRRRFIDLKKLELEINEFARDKVQVIDLRFSDRDKVRSIKANAQMAKKTYRVRIKIEKNIEPAKIMDLEESLSDITIDQETPNRVLHRRSDRIRRKKIFLFTVENIKDNEFTATITSQGGTYIKELISGDNGRTIPNVSKLLGDIECTVLELDVVNVDSSY
jgi:tRNA pseudouridine synthase 10